MQDREIFPCLQGNLSLSCTICRCLILYLTFISSCALFDSYVLLADDHVNKVSYFSFMSIKKVIPYFCVLREGYYVIIWLIVRDRPFNLKEGGGLWFFVSFRNFDSDNTRVRIFIFYVAPSAKFFPEFNIRLYDKNSESYYFFFLHQNQNIFFSNIGNQNIFLEKKT